MKVYVAGHTGLVGRATTRALLAAGHDVWAPSDRRDLSDRRTALGCVAQAVNHGAEAMVMAAARVGGIGANEGYPADFLDQNLAISSNLLWAAHCFQLARVVNLGSSCIYPRDSVQPMKEEALLSGRLEPTNEGYAVAKIAALKLTQAYRRQEGHRFVSLMPCNLYGPGDRYCLETSHVIPTMIMKFEEARISGGPVRLWGSGTPLREFLHVDDLARAIVWALEEYDDDLWLNVGSDEEFTIRELAHLIGDAVGYEGSIEWDTTRPDGVPRKKLDWSRIASHGWRPTIPLREGVRTAIDDYRARSSPPASSDRAD